MSVLRLRPWGLRLTAYAQDRHRHLAACAIYLLLSAAVAWPLLAHFGSALPARGESTRALWGFWWWKQALFVEWRSPFTCDLLRWPHGASLALERWDLPSTLATLPLWAAVPALPAPALYNVALFASFPLAGLFMYWLCHELWGGWVGPLVAGALYTFGTWHFAHLGTLPLASLQWGPLYFLGLVRTVRRHGPGGPLLGGLALALAATASAHHLLACLAGTAVLLAGWAARDRQALLAKPVLRRAALLVGVFAVLAGWRYVAMLRAAGAPLAAGGTADQSSADLAAFFLSNPTNVWSRWRDAAPPWSGDGAYLGYVLLALGVAGGVRARAARPWLLAGAAGALLALGPHLHVGGRALQSILLPYGWLERLIPPLAAGSPAALAWLAPFGLAVAAAFALDDVARSGRRGVALAFGIGALALVEVWPRPPATVAWPAPRFLRSLAADPERWTVLDASQEPRALWHQMLHAHPQIGGPVARAPVQRDPFLTGTPALRPFFGDGLATLDRREAVRALQELRVRFVVVEAGRLAQARALELPLVYQSGGPSGLSDGRSATPGDAQGGAADAALWVFEVPPVPAA